MSSRRKAALTRLTLQFVVALSLALTFDFSLVQADEVTRGLVVTWDFRSDPGQTSNFYVGEREIPVKYSDAGCLAGFSLEQVRYEYSGTTEDGQRAPKGPPFVMFTIRKHFEGGFELLPRITIVQSEEKRKVPIEFPFREKHMAAPVEDWSASDIDVVIGAPGAIMNLNNPMGWSEIQIRCD